MLDIARRTGGAVEDVNDEQIVDAIKLLARTEGIFAETAGGVTVGVTRKLIENGLLDPALTTVVLNTGDGLKTLDAVALGPPGLTATIRPYAWTPSRHGVAAQPAALTRAPDRRHSMSVNVRIPTILRTYTGGKAEVPPRARPSPRSSADLEKNHTGIGARVLDDQGKLRRFVNVYVNDDDVRFEQGLETATPDGAGVSIIPAVAGG